MYFTKEALLLFDCVISLHDLSDLLFVLVEIVDTHEAQSASPE